MKANLSKAIRNHAESLGIDDYLSLFGLNFESAKGIINKMTKEDLDKYCNFVEQPFQSNNKEGEVQVKSLIEILSEKEFVQFSHGNVMKEISEYIIDVNNFLIMTMPKLKIKLKEFKKSESEEKMFIEKIDRLNYSELVEIFDSKETLANFFRV